MYIIFAEQIHGFALFSSVISFLLFYYLICDWLIVMFKSRVVLLILFVASGYAGVYLISALLLYIQNSPILKGRVAMEFDYGMTRGFESEAVFVDKTRAAVLPHSGETREVGEYVAFSQGDGKGVEGVALLVKLCKQRFKKVFFEGETCIARGEHAVFEGFQLFRDIAFVAFECLAARPVQGGAFRLAARDFDVVAVHAVVAHFQVGNAAFFAFCGFEVHENVFAVFAEINEFVEFGMIALAKDAAVFRSEWRKIGK